MATASWGHLAPRIQALVDIRPALLHRLARAPVAAFHAYAIFVQENPDLDPETTAATLDASDPAKLLNAIVGEAARPLFKALGKIDIPRALPLSLYRRLTALCTGDVAHLLARVDVVGIGTIRTLEKLTAVGREEPLLRAAGHALLDPDGPDVHEIADMLLLLRIAGLSQGAEEQLRATFARAKTGATIIRAINRALADMPLPGLGVDIAGDAPFRPVRTLGELRACGLRFENCLRWDGNRMQSAICGTLAIVEWTGGPKPVLIGFKIVARGPDGVMAAIKEMGGVGNADVDYRTGQRIHVALGKLRGLKLVRSPAGRLLSHMLHAARRQSSPRPATRHPPGIVGAERTAAATPEVAPHAPIR
jgi:hypothetical protein